MPEHASAEAAGRVPGRADGKLLAARLDVHAHGLPVHVLRRETRLAVGLTHWHPLLHPASMKLPRAFKINLDLFMFVCFLEQWRVNFH